MMPYQMRLASLREAMADQSFQAIIVPLSDPFLAEYVTARDQLIDYLTGFRGSAGSLVVTGENARLFVDGRYTLQARDQTNPCLVSIGDYKGLSPLIWAGSMIAKGQALGYDPEVISYQNYQRFRAYADSEGFRLVALDGSFWQSLWPDRPPYPNRPLFEHEVIYAGESRIEKLAKLRADMAKGRLDHLVINRLESLAWLLNLRGSDIDFTPLFHGRALIDQLRVRLFVDESRCPEEIKEALSDLVVFHSPDTWGDELEALSHERSRVLVDPETANAFIGLSLEQGAAEIVRDKDPVIIRQAVKNEVECEGMRQCHRRDGLALCRFLSWLDHLEERHLPSEGEAAEKLAAFRAENDLFVSLSFPSISAFGAHAALPHYHHEAGGGARLAHGQAYLIDSGGQYRDGTTDVTRTVALGSVSDDVKVSYTLVLKGLIALSRARFPLGVTGGQLDGLARQFLWREGFDYSHGTGHGVGAFLGVHEGPNRISPRGGDTVLQPGMIQSNEPGIYREGAYGIRLENLILVQELTQSNVTETALLGFETLTLAPFDQRLIRTDRLDSEERLWLDLYHQEVWRVLSPDLDAPERRWLEQATKPLV